MNSHLYKKTLLLFIIIFPVYTFASKTPVTNYVETKEKKVALTFDADMTSFMLQELKSGKVKSWYNKQVIDVLEKEQVPATLFLTGMWIEQYATITQTLATNTLFEIGNHSYSHPAFDKHCYNLKSIKEAEDILEVSKTKELLNKYVVNNKMYFRFPGLCYNNEDLNMLNTQNYIAIGGDVYGGDGFQDDPNKIVYNVIHKVKSGSIVVLHMMGGKNAPQTANALPSIIKKLKDKGYTFVKVSDLLELRDATPAPSNILGNVLKLSI